MRKEQALKYKNPYIDQYENADEYIVVNENDPDLHPIKIPLPEPPDWRKIDGWGLPAKDQYFKHEAIPTKLVDIQKESYEDARKEANIYKRSNDQTITNHLKLIWDKIDERQHTLKKEIKWMQKMFYHQENGYWFFNNGKPTYINGWFWFLLNWWKIHNVEVNEYRDRDRRWFLFMEFAYKDRTAPLLDKDGGLVYDEEGFLKLRDTGARTCYGVNVLKRRRCGDTTKSSCINFNIVSTNVEAHGGIQGNSETTAANVFQNHVMFPYNKLPFFFRPCAISYQSKKRLELDHPDLDKKIDSFIDYADVAGANFYDGKKLWFYHSDEPGKVTSNDIERRHQVVRNCLSLGGSSDIFGFTIYTTTVDEMDKQSGIQFKKLSDGCKYEERNLNGQTKTGLYNLFMPSYDGLDTFIGRYGESIIDDPTPSQEMYLRKKKWAKYNNEGKCIGAKEYLENQRAGLADDEEKLVEEKRMFPLTYKECFTPPAKEDMFDTAILRQRLLQLDDDTEAYLTGNFIWKDEFGSDVVFIPTNNGRFNISKQLSDVEANQKYRDYNVWRPRSTEFVASCDAFRLEETRYSRMSDGGGAVKWKYDERVDGDKDIHLRESDRLVCTYRNRPSLDEYCEDMLKMCVYYGAMMYPEMNVDHVFRYFVDKGFGGYLLYDTDVETGKPKASPGFHTVGSHAKPKIFNLLEQYIQRTGMRCRHQDFLQECLDIKDMSDMKNYDLLVSVAGCLLAEQSMYSDYLKRATNDNIDIGDLWL